MRSLVNLLLQLGARFMVALGAVVLTVLLFLVLPLIQVIGESQESDLIVQSVDIPNIPPPPPPPEEEPEEEQEEEEAPPELNEEAPPLDLSQLEIALNTGMSDSWTGGDFAMKLTSVMAKGDDVDALFSLADLDQKPRVIYQPSPTLSAKVRKKAPGTVYVVFVVDQRGRVVNPSVQKSSDPIFERPALAAVKKWRFEPGKRKGEAVRFRMRVPITFPAG